MDDLSNSIFTYYRANLYHLSAYGQFHFASRLYLWDQHVGTHEVLETLRPWFTADNNIQEALRRTKRSAVLHPDFGSKNARAVREPYFNRYPEITNYIPVLLKIMYLRTVYGIDCRTEFQKLFPGNDVRASVERLLADRTAVALLSSQAINFFYSWAQLGEENETMISPEHFLSIGRSHYDRTNKLQVQLLIYLYTHCIIGASHFYYRLVPKAQLATYLAMADELETLIDTQFDTINLDNKCEFLVSCKILNRPTRLENRIRDEASKSISSEGMFLIDCKNTNPQTTNTTFDTSEHRNVLFIMSTSDFHPIGN